MVSIGHNELMLDIGCGDVFMAKCKTAVSLNALEILLCCTEPSVLCHSENVASDVVDVVVFVLVS